MTNFERPTNDSRMNHPIHTAMLKTLRTTVFALAVIPALILLGCDEVGDEARDAQMSDTADAMPRSGADMGEMDGMPMGYVPDSLARTQLAPLVKAFYNGGELFFIHTEASDPAIADTLTAMMGPQVVAIPGLAQAPPALTSPIYVFANGVEGMGPIGYQPDVFPTVPGDEGYQPLRAVHLVRWNTGETPEELKSADAVRQAEQQGRLTIEETGAVINAPVLAWPGGHRGM